SAVNARVASLDVTVRTAAFTTIDPARDAVRLATTHAVELVLLDAPPRLGANRLPERLVALLERSPRTSESSRTRGSSSGTERVCSCRSEAASTTGRRLN